MGKKPTYEELTVTVRELEKKVGKRALIEEKLLESQKLLGDILTASAVGIAHARDRKIVWANQSMVEMFGYTRKGQYMGRDTVILYADEAEYSRVGRAVYEQQKTGKVIELDARLQRHDGSLFDGNVRVNILDPQNPKKGIIVSVIDISERKQAEMALRESEEKYRLLIENAMDAIFIAQDGVIKFANPRAERMTGYSAVQLVKIPFVNIIHREDRNMVLERHLKRLKGEDPPSIYTFRIINRAGDVLSVEINSVLVDWEARSATLNFLRDITTQKILEAQLQQAQKMEALGTLAGGIAHDFNNLLMAIQGRASMMMINKGSKHPDFEHLKGIEGHVESAADLTRQLLGLARGGKYQVKPTDLNELIKKVNRMFSRTKKEITIHGKYKKDLWSVEVDRGQIEQVLLNLYVNAWQAMTGGGDLFSETDNVLLDENFARPFSLEPGKFVKISVTDTGIGMDKKTQEKIFDPFFTTKKMGTGTGLGLASAYGIIMNHCGVINVDSKKGHGSTFHIYLPASDKEIFEEKTAGTDPLKGSETLLLVDDEDIIIEVVRQPLEKLGYKILTAESGKRAIEIYEKNKEKIGIVILDMIMPGMGGAEVYEKMKEMHPGVKVLLSSGYSINGQATDILARGCNGFIQKPFKMKELSQKLREILDKRS